jgi:RimJ/RimL family protein N-acetyltransferase
MTVHDSRLPRIDIATDVPALRLVALSPDDADPLYALIDRSRRHLTQHGDWTDLGEGTPESVQASLGEPDDQGTRFGIWLEEQLIGRDDQSPRAAGNFVLGYWLGSEFTGKGSATAACRALIAYGKAELGATAIYAGVTKGNVKSEALLARLGLVVLEDRGSYTLFRLTLT